MNKLEIVGNTMKFEMADSGNPILNGINKASENIVSAQVEWFLKPIGEFANQLLLNFMDFLTLYMPEIIGIVTLLAGALLVFGFRLPKVLIGYTGALTFALCWLSYFN